MEDKVHIRIYKPAENRTGIKGWMSRATQKVFDQAVFELIEKPEGLKFGIAGVDSKRQLRIHRSGTFSFTPRLQDREKYIGNYILGKEDEEGWWLERVK